MLSSLLEYAKVRILQEAEAGRSVSKLKLIEYEFAGLWKKKIPCNNVNKR
jgi:hypothetical protein